MPYYTYILYSDSLGKFYIGHTGDELAEPLRRHLSEHDGFTGKAKDWVIAYFEKYDTKPEANARERQIKGWKSSKMIQALIEKHSPAGSEHPDL